jgi:hypothetical protein
VGDIDRGGIRCVGLSQRSGPGDRQDRLILPRVEKVNGELWNVEFATVEKVKDPVKAVLK